MSEMNGSDRCDDIGQVIAEGVLIDAMAAAPIGRDPAFDDGAGGELVSWIMRWRRDVESNHDRKSRQDAG